MNANLHLDLKQLSPLFLRYRASIATLIILGLVGYTGIQISRVTSVQPDQAYLQAQQSNTKTTTLRIDKQTLDQLRALKPAGDTNVPVTVGKENPFTLN